MVNEVDPATHEPGPLCDRAWRTAGEGSPYVSEFALMEFAAVLGMSTDGGRAYLCGVAELRYRLPHLWEQVETGVLPVWRVLEIAKDTWTLPEDGAIFVDRHLADAAVSSVAAQLADLGCTESLEVRRSMAAGQIARAQGALDLGAAGSSEDEAGGCEAPRCARRASTPGVRWCCTCT